MVEYFGLYRSKEEAGAAKIRARNKFPDHTGVKLSLVKKTAYSVRVVRPKQTQSKKKTGTRTGGSRRLF